MNLKMSKQCSQHKMEQMIWNLLIGQHWNRAEVSTFGSISGLQNGHIQQKMTSRNKFYTNFNFVIKFIKEFFSLLCVLQNQRELKHWQPIRVDRCWFDSISFELLRHSLVDLYLGASPWTTFNVFSNSLIGFLFSKSL